MPNRLDAIALPLNYSLSFLKTLVLILIIAQCAEGLHSAQASSRGDMFSDRGFIMTDRPWIAGDPPRSDVFPHKDYPALSPNKDMFDHVKPPVTYYGSADMFNPRPKPIPHNSLYD